MGVFKQEHLMVRMPGDGVESVIPSLAVPAALTSGTGANAFGAYVALGTPSTGMVLSQAIVSLTTLNGNTNRGFMELRAGGAGTFEQLATDSGVSDNTTKDAAGAVNSSWNLHPQFIAANQAIEARYWAGIANSAANIFLFYWADTAYPKFSSIMTNNNFLSGQEVGVGTYSPNLSSNGLGNVTGGTAWNFGTWTQMIGTANACLVTGIKPQPSAAWSIGRSAIVEVGVDTGTATVTAAFRTGVSYGWNVLQKIEPPIYCPQGFNIYIRSAGNTVSASNTWYVKTQGLI